MTDTTGGDDDGSGLGGDGMFEKKNYSYRETVNFIKLPLVVCSYVLFFQNKMRLLAGYLETSTYEFFFSFSITFLSYIRRLIVGVFSVRDE